MAAMAQLDCGACGYVCKTYSEAIADGEEKSLTLCSPGGRETAKTLKKLLKEESPNGQPKSESTNGHASKTTTNGYSRTNPFPAKLKASWNLNKEGSAKHTSHVVIDIAGVGVGGRRHMMVTSQGMLSMSWKHADDRDGCPEGTREMRFVDETFDDGFLCVGSSEVGLHGDHGVFVVRPGDDVKWIQKR